MAKKLTEKEKNQKQIKRKVKKFMDVVRAFIEQKNGGILPPEYECSLVLLETYYEQFLSLSAEIDGLDSLITIGRYGPTPSPLLAARDKASVRLETMMRELGLTLKAQSKLEIIEPVVEQSPLEAFVKNKIEKR